VPGTSTEIAADRTEFSKTFLNPDGSQTLESSTAPMNFKATSGGWEPIDTSVVADLAVRGGLRSSANAWTAHFEPLPTGLVVDTASGSALSYAPVGASAVDPMVGSTSNSVIYRNAWPGVDLEYLVFQNQVKEDIIVRSAAGVSSFAFGTGSTGYVSDGAGGLNPVGSFGAVTPDIEPPIVFDSSQQVLQQAAPTITASGSGAHHLTVAVASSLWTSLPASSYPVVIDPSVIYGSGDLQHYSSTGASCSCGLTTGNSYNVNGNTSNIYWRAIGMFNYAPIDGDYVSAASIQLGNNKGLTSNETVSVYHASAWSYSGAVSGSVLASGTGGSSANFTGSGLLSDYRSWVENSTSPPALGFQGMELANNATFQDYLAYQLTLTYYPIPVSPTGRSVKPCSSVCSSPIDTNSATPTLTGEASNSGSLNESYNFQIWSGWSSSPTTEAASGTVSNVAYGSQASWTDTTALSDGGEYEYRVEACITADTADCGAWSSGWVTFTVYTTPPGAPSISSTTDATQPTWNTSTTFTGTWTASAPSGIAGYSVVLDNTASTVPAAAVSQTSTSYTNSSMTSGVWYLHVRAGDNAGNWSTTATYGFNVQTANPTWEAPTSGGTSNGSETLTAGSGSTATGATFKVYYQGTWKTVATATGPGGGTWTATWNTAAMTGSSYTFGDGPYLLGVVIQYPGGPAPLFSGPIAWVENHGPTLPAETAVGSNPSEPDVTHLMTKATDAASNASVDDSNGQLDVAVTDTNTPGPSSLPIGLSRTYSSANAGLFGPFGYGWTDNYNMSVASDTVYGTSTEPVEDVTQENGSVVRFAENTTNDAWSAASQVDATLSYSGSQWTFTRNGQDKYVFDSIGRLMEEIDLVGFDTVLAYNGTTTQLLSVTSYTTPNTTSGASLTLSFTWGDCVPGVSSPVCVTQVTDPGSRTVGYHYNSADQLTQVTDVAGNVTYYGYNTASDLTSIEDAAANTTSYAYNTNRPVEVANETDPGHNQPGYNWAYNVPDVFDDGTVTVTDPLGNATVDTVAGGLVKQVNGPNNSTETQVAPSSVSDGPATITTGVNGTSETSTVTYNSPGGIASVDDVTLSTDAVGNTTMTEYNANNQVWCQVDAADYANDKTCLSFPQIPTALPGADDLYTFTGYSGSYSGLGLTINIYNGNLLADTVDPLGNINAHSYTTGGPNPPAGLLYCTIDPAEYATGTTCAPYGSHNTGTSSYTFDSLGRKLTQTDPDGDTTSYAYINTSLPDAVTTMTGPDPGEVTNYTYNTQGQTTQTVVTFGSYTATTLDAYDANGNKYCEVAPAETAKGVTCPTTPPTSPPIPGSDPYPGATITTYNGNNQAIQTTNPLGGITLDAYDANGNQYCEVAPAETAKGVTCPTTPPAQPALGEAAYLGATITTYDSLNRVIQVTNPLGGITVTNSYDANSNPIQTTVESGSAGAPNVVTDTSYDADNRVTSTTVDPGTPLAQTTNSSYDPNGHVYCTISANATQNGAGHCPIWQNSWIAEPPPPSTLYSTNPTTAQADDATTTFYNADGQQVQTTNADIDTSMSIADGDGRTYCTSGATNIATWLTAHPAGGWPYMCPSTPPTTAAATGYTVTIYDPAGLTQSSTDPTGDTTAYTYADGQVATTTDPRGETTTDCYYYQSATCAASAPASGGSANNLYSTTTPATAADPTGETTTYTYYPGGQADTTTTPAGTTTDTYDANSDLTSVAYSGTASGYTTPTNLSYTYNPDGTRNTMVDATGTTTYTYDATGDVTAKTLAATGGLSNTTTGYSYYPTAVLDTVTYPNYSTYTNPTVTYAYDATGAMTSETDWLANQVTFGHDFDGNNTAQDNNVSTSNPNGTSSTSFAYDNADYSTTAISTLNCGTSSGTLTQAFSGTGGSRNPDGQLTQYQTSYTSPCSGAASQRDYSYDQAGRVAYQGTSPQGSNTNTFAYDASGDPTTISSHDSSGNYNTYTQTFDPAGENTSQTPGSGSNGTATTYTYDTLGDQTQGTTAANATTYTYNQTGQMTEATTPTATATYTPNGDNLEAAEQTGTTTTQYTWNTTGTLPLILSDTTNDYIYGPGTTPVEQISLQTSAPTYLTFSPSASTWLSSNSAGDQTGYWGYDAFGTLSYGTPTSAFGYSGQYTDSVTGLVNDRSRWQQPQTGEFITRDSQFSSTDSAYVYAYDDPVQTTDPTGQSPDYWEYFQYNRGAAESFAWNQALRGCASGFPCFGDNCTNFVSESLAAGGIPYDGATGAGGLSYDPNAWYGYAYGTRFGIVVGWSKTWSVIKDNTNDNFFTWALNDGLATLVGTWRAAYPSQAPPRNPAGLQGGDVIAYNWASKGHWHSAFVAVCGASLIGNGCLVDEQTSNRRGQFWTLAQYQGAFGPAYETTYYFIHIRSSGYIR
jgi:RHS repeat-associated protein